MITKDKKLVKKHWGHEEWFADGVATPFALKRILFLAGNRTSLQVHQHKFETTFVLSGTGKLYKSKEPLLDADTWNPKLNTVASKKELL